MKNHSIYLAALLLVTASGCASSALSPEGAKVKLMKNDPPTGCEEAGTVTSAVSGFKSMEYEAHKNRIRNQAAEMGANYVRMETTDKHGFINGTAFRCPNL